MHSNFQKKNYLFNDKLHLDGTMALSYRALDFCLTLTQLESHTYPPTGLEWEGS